VAHSAHSLHDPLSVEEQKILLLSTMLYPLSDCYTTNKKVSSAVCCTH
jgi:hypothetical protein